MAQTFRDFIVECELYPYSKENFEIMKECTELKLQEKYLENARYMEAVADIYTEANGYHLSEGYFQEAADTSFLEAIEAEAEKKKVGIFGKILKGIQWLIGKLAKFFHFIGSKLDKLAGNTEAVAQKIQVIDISPDNIEALKDALMLQIDEGKELVSVGKAITTDALNLSKMHFVGISANVLNLVKYYLAILFGAENIRILPNVQAGPLNLNDFMTEETGLVDVNTLVGIIDTLSKNSEGGVPFNSSGIANVASVFDNALKSTRKTGVNINLSSNKIDEIVKKLEAYQGTLGKLQNDLNNKLEDADRNRTEADDLKALSEFITNKLSGSISKTIEFYSKLLQYKNTGLKNVNAFADQQAGKTTEQPEEKKAEEKPAEPAKEENK